MNGQMDFFYYFIIGSTLLLSVVGLWFTVLIHRMDRWSKRFFLIFFAILLLSGVSALVEMRLYHYAAPASVILATLILETVMLSLSVPMQTAYLLHFCGENMRSGRLLRAVLVLWAVFFILIVCTPFVEGFISFEPEARYHRGPVYPLLLTPIIAALVLNFIGTLRRRAMLSRKAFLGFAIAQVPMMLALIVNLFADAVPIFDISFVLSALVMYSFILSDQIEQSLGSQRKIAEQQREIARQQREIAHERSSVMVLQMRPHFIYNTLMSIYSLCRIDPQKARQLTNDFTNYLRRNFNAVASDSVVPFSAELEHTRTYLAIEQALYDDLLVVDYDTRVSCFSLPPLTLQPIVENAVKHNLDPDSDPLHISICTLHTDSATEIIVKDNGSGFNPASDDDEPHIALNNIRQRLVIMCGGSLSITPNEGGGTVVTVTIPDSGGTGYGASGF